MLEQNIPQIDINLPSNAGKCKFVAALRTDGLGVRIMAMLNAMAVSEIASVPFKFSWNDNKSGNIYHTVKAADQMFDKEFVQAYLVDSLSDIPKITLHDLLSAEVEQGYYHCPQSISGELRSNELINGALKNFNWRACFMKIGFSRSLLEARDAALAIAVKENTTALHLRAGDVVYAGFRRSGYYVNKAIPYPIAVDILESMQNILIFGQDEDLCNFLKNKYPSVVLSKDLMPSGYSEEQKAIFDIVLMSLCSDIVAGRSGFSITSSLLSGVKIREPEKLYSVKDFINISSEWIYNDLYSSGVPALQLSYACLSLLTKGRGQLNHEEVMNLLDVAEDSDTENGLFPFLRLINVLENDGIESANSIFSRMSEKKIKQILEVIEVNYGISALIKYVEDQRFEEVIQNTANEKSAVSVFLMAVIHNSRGDRDSALKILEDSQDLSSMNSKLVVDFMQKLSTL